MRSTSPPTLTSTGARASIPSAVLEPNPVQRPKALDVDPVADPLGARLGHPGLERQPAQGVRHGEHPIGPAQGRPLLAAAPGITGGARLGTAQRDAHRQTQPASEPGRGIAVRVGEVGIDEVGPTGALEPAKQCERGKRHHRPVQPLGQARQRKEPRKVDIDTLLGLARRRERAKVRPAPSNQAIERRPGLRRDHRQRQLPGDPEHALANEQTGPGPGRTRKQRGEDDDARELGRVHESGGQIGVGPLRASELGTQRQGKTPSGRRLVKTPAGGVYPKIIILIGGEQVINCETRAQSSPGPGGT